MPLFTLHLFKFIFAVIHNAANMGICGGSDFYKVKVFFCGDSKGIFKRDNAELCAVGIDHADFFFADLIIDEQFLLSYCQTPPKK